MHVELELAQAKIDHLVMGLDVPPSLPKLYTGKGFPHEGESVWFDASNNKFWYYSTSSNMWLREVGKKLFVYAGNYSEFTDWCTNHNLSIHNSKIKYISSDITLRGAKNYYYVKYGTWRDRPKEELIMIEHYLTQQLVNMGSTNPIQLNDNDPYSELILLKKQQQQFIEERKENGY